MLLTQGHKLAHYEILAPIGKGGMGEVYRARDVKLGRDVAIKVLPEEFAGDEERIARFKREANILASLNHSNIASIYGLEHTDTNDIHYLVLELVEGETLADRITHGPIPIEEAIPMFLQIASGLDAAHEKGIIHRDLKPANIKLTPDEDIKILDFGLAKAFADDSSDANSSLSPTITRNATRAGVILGTAAYMSPEQARGKRVDKRADIWSFGVVFYEALSGKRVFTGETVSDVLAAVLTRDVDFGALPDATPPNVRRLLRRCFERDPKRRLRDIGEARIALEEGPAPEPAAKESDSGTRSSVVAGLLALLFVAGAAALWGWLRPVAAPPRPVARLQLALPGDFHLPGHRSPGVAISADGRLIALPVVNKEGELQLSLYHMENGAVDTMPALREATDPFFSPDGKWLGYVHDERLTKVAVGEGEPVALAEAHNETGFGECWTQDDAIIFSPNYDKGLWRVSAGGGEATMLTEPDAARKEVGHWFPQILPDGRHVLFTNYSTPIQDRRIEVLSLDSGERKTIVEGGFFGRYVPSGHLIYLGRDGALMAQRFDLEKLEAEGLPIPLTGDVYANTDGHASLDFAGNGTLVYAPITAMSPDRNLVWVDRKGNVEPVRAEPRRYMHPRLSPDQQRIAVTVENGVSSDIWVLERSSGTLSRISFGDGADFNPIWSPNGRRLFYTSEKNVLNIYVRAADASSDEEPVLSTRYDTLETSISPTGDRLAFLGRYQQADGSSLDGAWLLPTDGHGTAQLVAAGAENAVFSPDGRFIAYASNASGRSEVYVQTVAGEAGKRQVSVDGGTDPLWSADGRELFFRNGKDMLSATVETSGGLRTGRPHVLFEWNYDYGRRTRNYDVAPDGRFLMVQVPESAERSRVVVVLNWFSELKRLLPRKD